MNEGGIVVVLVDALRVTQDIYCCSLGSRKDACHVINVRSVPNIRGASAQITMKHLVARALPSLPTSDILYSNNAGG